MPLFGDSINCCGVHGLIALGDGCKRRHEASSCAEEGASLALTVTLTIDIMYKFPLLCAPRRSISSPLPRNEKVRLGCSAERLTDDTVQVL